MPVERPDAAALQVFLSACGEAPLAGTGETWLGYYRLPTTAGRRLIRLFDSDDDRAAAAARLDCLGEAGIPCPQPIADACDAASHRLGGQAALLLTCPPGMTAADYTSARCAALGGLLAQSHRAGEVCASVQAGVRTVREWRETAAALAPGLPREEAVLLLDEVRFQGLFRFGDLPQGLVHGNVTRDSALFEGERASGILGLEDGRPDAWLRDLASAADACCGHGDGSLDGERTQTLLQAYHGQRPLTPIERGAWPVMLRAVALQRWVEALQAGSASAADACARLRDRIAHESELQRYWP
ncbi:hypothetical protein Thpro_021536 [Acidihalobacter prosperus]|uniref:Homoserine kinase n=1 Tax=Acidihalobacter prosperus TaxID=160660 RepID=A0A1A6C3S2_9GAMM|nr:hypothetical protein Thpro_021536 [Acidihalobacter prosperus]